MSDPAVDAAMRAEADGWIHRQHAEAGAREALAPLRDRHTAGYGFKLPRREGDRPEVFCEACHVKWPCADARLIYPEEEL
ncbi:hypothetical protein PBI_BLUEBERRY_76 [Gordonia phage Blueberry]|uniref:Uncharacterized protein n=1 Tax=Gordonia phage Azula TaxID=2762397 RepID=A0A7G8LKW6_9CAUD|nr:hypothetical protein BH771_gp76 [Gordonia phage Blueberry]YP_010110003.1 hypothetical protein KNV23_gp77 [Gordonia phage Azula]QGJ97451.1 hypothetical protein SEA_GAMBINO_79 [Gordonia phage Gambino]QZD97509.1 hypothetical protein SEA_MISSRONA_77 [Gordonia phage MissRona]ANA85538.1 hypothetical protein PBI_BLUEBERRY_76 [Gordonia phage Blueberry]QNJ57888.1 hypothetical protein SEA_AZULA_77 [Gordonia phage Azula]